jgi:hypothetical protein
MYILGCSLTEHCPPVCPKCTWECFLIFLPVIALICHSHMWRPSYRSFVSFFVQSSKWFHESLSAGTNEHSRTQPTTDISVFPIIYYLQSSKLKFYGDFFPNSHSRGEPVTVAAQSKARTVFARSNAGIVGSNPTQDMGVCVCVYSMFVLPYV